MRLLLQFEHVFSNLNGPVKSGLARLYHFITFFVECMALNWILLFSVQVVLTSEPPKYHSTCHIFKILGPEKLFLLHILEFLSKQNLNREKERHAIPYYFE